MHITLTGNLGSGKSTICRILTEKYGFELYSTGKVIREIADEMGISVLEMNELMSKDHKYDHMIDDKTAQISRENPDKNILFDSRLAWNFVEKSFKVFLSVDLAEAARRVYADASRGDVESYKSEADAAEQLAARAANEDARYEEIYGIHYFDFNNYNLILDSSYATPDVIAELLMREAVARCNEEPEKRGQMLISPKRLGFAKTKRGSVGSAPGLAMCGEKNPDGDGKCVIASEGDPISALKGSGQECPETGVAGSAVVADEKIDTTSVPVAEDTSTGCVGEIAPGRVTVQVDGNKMTVVDGDMYVKRAAEKGYGYVAANLA